MLSDDDWLDDPLDLVAVLDDGFPFDGRPLSARAIFEPETKTRTAQKRADALSLLLELRATLNEMMVQFRGTREQVERLDIRLERLERAHLRVPESMLVKTHPEPASLRSAEAPSMCHSIKVAVRPTQLDDLSADLIALIVSVVDRDDLFAVALSARKLRAAVTQNRRLCCGTITSIRSIHGTLPRLQWAVSCGLPLSPRLCVLSAERGALPQLAWLRSIGCAWDVQTTVAAALAGHLDLLRWAHLNGCPCNETTISSAAYGGHLEVLRWLRDNGCEWNWSTSSKAAEGGHLSVLQWLRAEGCPWDRWLCAGAAGSGHLEVLQWARANGCPWNGWTCSAAASDGHLEVIKWARANGCPWDASTCKTAAYCGHLNVLKWARAEGCPWDYEDVLRCAQISKTRTSQPHLAAEMVTWIEAQHG